MIEDETKDKEYYFRKIVQMLYSRPVKESEEQVRFCFDNRHNPMFKREKNNWYVRDAIKFLRLHRAVHNSSKEELRKYGVDVENKHERKED